MNKSCVACGMSLESVTSYHPYVSCVLFKYLKNGDHVEANLKAVVEYGMRAERAGVSLDDAMQNIALVLNRKEEQEPQ